MRISVIVLLIIAIIFGLLSVYFWVLKAKNMDNEFVVIGKDDNGKEIKLASGDVIELGLETVGAAGYDWYIYNLDTEHLRLISEETKSAPRQDLVGAPVTKVWKFKALKAGKSKISLDYYRIWEGKEKAIDHFSIRTIIE